jgi:hypothetical protein
LIIGNLGKIKPMEIPKSFETLASDDLGKLNMKKMVVQ